MKFLDQAKIFVKSGDGGAGCVGFRREKFIEYGGPDGGDGGRGGNVTVMAKANLNTLIDFRYQQHFKAQRGGHGMGQNRSGAKGGEIIIEMPVGTQIFEEDNETLVADLTEPGQTVVLAKGGDGGFGNTHYKSSTNQAPKRADPGWPGEERWLWLRLKLIADVGLVGLPNAGKSTFLAATSRARPKIADYPFTTLKPQLGVVSVDNAEFVVADLPGLIECAAEGRGLGHRFLGHVERCGALLHLIDGTEEDIVGAYKSIRGELDAYGHGLVDKAEIIGLNKVDALDAKTIKKKITALTRATKKLSPGAQILPLSGVAGTGVTDVLRALHKLVRKHRAAAAKREVKKEEETVL